MTKEKPPKEPQGGERCSLTDGRQVTILSRLGKSAYRVINPQGRIEIIYPAQIKSQEATH